MIICVCRNVSDREIARLAVSGCADFPALQAMTGVSTACGVCREFAEDAFREAQGAACGGCPGARHCGESVVALPLGV